MNYAKFILEKIYRNWLNAIPFLLVMIFVVFIFINFRMGAFSVIQNPKHSGENEIEQIKKDILTFQDQIEKSDETSKNYEYSKKNLDIAEHRLTFLTQRLDAIKSENWTEYYKNDLELESFALKRVESDRNLYDVELIKALRLNIDYTQYMMDQNVGFDSRFKPIQGISYTTSVIDEFMPIMLALLLIFITSTVYCSAFIGNLDIQRLLPISRLRKQCSKLFVGAISGVFIVFFISLISTLSGTLGNTFGNFSSPVLSFSIQGADKYIAFHSIFLQLLTLLGLSILFIVNLVSVISIFMRKNMQCLLISLAVVIGGLLITTQIVPLYSIAHVLPTTYLNSFKVVSGELLSITQNMNVNFFNGVIVLSISNGILFLLYYYVPVLLTRRVSNG